MIARGAWVECMFRLDGRVWTRACKRTCRDVDPREHWWMDERPATVQVGCGPYGLVQSRLLSRVCCTAWVQCVCGSACRTGQEHSTVLCSTSHTHPISTAYQSDAASSKSSAPGRCLWKSRGSPVKQNMPERARFPRNRNNPTQQLFHMPRSAAPCSRRSGTLGRRRARGHEDAIDASRGTAASGRFLWG